MKAKALVALIISIVSWSLVYNAVMATNAEAKTSTNTPKILSPETSAQEPVSFTVFDVKRPATRAGKTLATVPREVYLYASRPPSERESYFDPYEVNKRKISNQSQRKRGKKRGKKKRVAKNKSFNIRGVSRGVSWYGKLIKVYRLYPVDTAVPYPSNEQLLLLEELRRDREERLARRKADLEAKRRAGNPIALEEPSLPTPALEDQEDDDDLTDLEEDDICGHKGEPCCTQARKGPCLVGLMCTDTDQGKSLCLEPPPPCGGFEQRCCEEAPICASESLSCLEGELNGSLPELCLFPPPPPLMKKVLVGVLEVTGVQNQVVRANVLFDGLSVRLKGRKHNRTYKRSARSEDPLYAVSVKDLGEWYSP